MSELTWDGTDETGGKHRNRHSSVNPASLKALAHPLRIQILEVLSRYGAQTSSSLATIVHESRGTTSYHLRQLAKHQFVREVIDRGTARERWWERSYDAVNFETKNISDDAADRDAIQLISREFEHHRASALIDFLESSGDVLSDEWSDASTINTINIRLTSAQLAELSSTVREFIVQQTDRIAAPAEHDDARPVQIHFNAFPLVTLKPQRRT